MSAEEDRAAVLAAAEELYGAVEAGDLDRLRDLWCATDDVVCVHPGAAPIHGHAAVMRSWAVVMAGTDYIQFFLTDVQVGLGADTAVLTCTENVLTGRSAETTAFHGGRAQALNVFRRTTQGWRLWIHQASAPHDHAGGTDRVGGL